MLEVVVLPLDFLNGVPHLYIPVPCEGGLSSLSGVLEDVHDTHLTF